MENAYFGSTCNQDTRWVLPQNTEFELRSRFQLAVIHVPIFKLILSSVVSVFFRTFNVYSFRKDFSSFCSEAEWRQIIEQRPWSTSNAPHATWSHLFNRSEICFWIVSLCVVPVSKSSFQRLPEPGMATFSVANCSKFTIWHFSVLESEDSCQQQCKSSLFC